MPMDHAELNMEEVLKRDSPWETYMTTKLITGTGLQLLRRYDNSSESQRAVLLDDDGPAYVRVFVSILRNIFKEEIVEYVLVLIDEMLTANPKRARLFHDKSLASEDIYEPFLCDMEFIELLFDRTDGSGCSRNFGQGVTLKKPSHPSRVIPTSINCLAILLKEPMVRSLFVQADGVKLLIPLISPASTQQSMQLLYETCLCLWLLSYCEPAIDYLAMTRGLSRLIEVVKGSTKEKGTFGSELVDLGLPQIVQSLKAQAWSDEVALQKDANAVVGIVTATCLALICAIT